MTGVDRQPLRVLIVAASPSIVGGHSVQATALAAGLSREGIEATCLAIDRPFPRWCRWARRVPVLRTVVNQCLYVAALRSVAHADVVHAFSASYWSFLLAPVPAMLAGRLLGRRVILHYHSGEVADHLEKWGGLVHPWLKLADEIVVCSAFQQGVFERYGHRARVIPNVVDLERFQYRDRTPLSPRFISTRSLEAYYGVDVILRAFARIRDVHPHATLTVAGRGSEEMRLRGLADELGVAAAVQFVGWIARDAMPAALDAADIFLNASTVDNQPVSILEAQASGLPVVSTQVGGIRELIEHERSGLLIPDSQPKDLAEAALSVLHQPELAVDMARRAREAATRFTWKVVCGNWQEVYGISARPPLMRSAERQAPVSISTPGAHA